MGQYGVANPNDYLPMTFFTVPGSSATTTTMTQTQLRDILLYNNGRISACGLLWDIESKHLGAGVYRVWLKKWSGV